jgi:hypothetical protein
MRSILQDSIKEQGFSTVQRVFMLLSLVIIPLVMLLLATFCFDAGYQGEKGDSWFYHIHQGWAGMTIFPVYFIASVSLARAIFDNKYRRTSWTNFVMVATFVVISGWYTYATLYMNLTKSEMTNFPFLAIIPGLACVNYLLFLLHILYKQERHKFCDFRFLFLWFSTLGVSIMLKYPLAKRIYEQLPAEMPRGYGDCFVVSAAAKGHPAVVRSWVDPEIGKPVNQQWYTFKAFEKELARYFPRLHFMLRRMYNHIGPWIAKRIHNRFQADCVYLLLKPLEWIVRILLQQLF